MNVYILTKNPFPYGMAATNRIKCYASAILSENINCEVIVWNCSDSNSKLPYKGVIDGIPYQFVGNSSRRSNCIFFGKIQSLLQQLWLPFFLLKRIKKDDIVLSYGLGLNFYWRFLIYVVHQKKAHYIQELCELPYGVTTETNKTIKDRKYYYKHLFPIFDGVIAISEALKDLAEKYCSPKCIIQKIPILVDYDKYNLPNNSFLSEYPYIFHSGTLYEQKDGILGMIEAFGIANQRLEYKIRFILTGTIEKSPHAKEIKVLIDKYQLHDLIHFTGYLSHEELKETLSKASLVIINKYVTQQNEYCFSTKLGEYMAAGKPIVITRVGEAMNWLTDDYDCVVVEPGDISQMSEAIIKVFHDIQFSTRISNNSRMTCIKSFDYRNYGKSLADMFSSMVRNTY